jgi:copper chaperone
MPAASTLSYNVPKMSCSHCVAAITDEVMALTGISDVNIDLDKKVVTVTGADLSDAAIREAITEAGFEAA